MDVELEELKVLKDNHEEAANNTEDTTKPETLLNAVLNNNVDEISNLIKRSKVGILKYKYPEHKNKTIVIIACINERVSTDTLNTLCASIKSHFYGIDCFDEDWYKWDPIHYVVRKADPEKLQVLLDNSDNVNSLTTFSENALHVLLEYQQCARPYNTLLYNGPDSRECVIINTEKKNILQCAKILIKAGIDINHSNLWNEVPICIAVRYRYLQIIEKLLKIPTIDLDNFKESGVTIRAYIKENYIYQDTVPQSNVLFEDPAKILFNYLKSGNEEAFIEFNNGNIKEYVDSIDGDNEFNSSGNMLQLCFKKGYLEYLQHELYGEELVKSDIKDNLMLKVFCSKGLGRCIEHLLRNGANPKLISRKFPESLLEAAAIVGYYPLVAILLHQNIHKITSKEIFEILPKLYETNHNLTNHVYYRKYVLSLLLNKLISLKGSHKILSVTELEVLNNILQRLNLKRDEEKEDDSENICQILKLGASLTKKLGDNTMIIQSIHTDILKLHFDDSVENNLFFYNSIIEDNPPNYSETRALQFLANNDEKRELLRHPLLVHFVHNKWLRNEYLFYADLALYVLFLLSIYTYMIISHKTHSASQTYAKPIIHEIIDGMFYFLLAFHFTKEAIQLIFLFRWKYFCDPSNYLEMIVIVSSFINIFKYNEYCAVIAILFSTVVFVTLLGQVPICAKYTIIFGSTKYFLQYAGFYFIQFVSFALVFYIIFPFPKSTENTSESNATDVNTSKEVTSEFLDITGDLFKSLFYTLVFFTGEFEDRVLEPTESKFFGRIVMTVFIFCMTIILNNLLVGLIVTDMDEMQKRGKLYKQINIANFISRMNAIVKRLYEFQNNRFIDWIIKILHIFEKGTNKIIDLSKCQHKDVFDDENFKYLKSIRSRKNIAYDKDLLKTIYDLIEERKLEKEKENRKRNNK